MEHILQFAVNIDDDTIKKRVEEAAISKVSNELKQNITNQIFSRSYGNNIVGFTNETKEIVKEVIESHKDEIISRAVDLVAESIKNSKKYRDALSSLVEDIT